MNDFQYHNITLNGHEICYLDEGEGPPLLLIHGIPTSSQLWRNVIPTLAQRHRVLAPDMLNYGRSAKPADANVSIEAQSRYMLGLLDALEIPVADVAAHDIGGGVAQIMAVNYPQRVRRLAVSNTVCFDSWPIPEFKPLQEPGAEDEMSLEAFVDMLRGFLPQGVNRPERLDTETLDMILEPWSSEDGKRALFANFRRLNPEYTQAIAGELKHLPHETLILWGHEDPFQKPEYAERLQATLPNARLEWIEDAGHWVMEEKPELVAASLDRFFT